MWEGQYIEDKKQGLRVVICVGAVIAAVAFVIWFIVMCNTPGYKYGSDAVEDAKGAIFTADQYLDGKLTEREYDRQIIYYGKDVDVSDKTYEIYANIDFMDLAVTDADILKYRNEIADMIGEEKR